MISVEEAQQIVAQKVIPGEEITIPLTEALGRITTQSLFSRFDFPLFSSSAMDGFAVRHEETASASPSQSCSLRVVDCVTAGTKPARPVREGEAIQIMTGAMLPEGATAVIPQEEVFLTPEKNIQITKKAESGAHIRRQGEEIREGEKALPAGTILTPATLGYLASVGILEVPVHRPPTVFIVPTGSELVSSPKQLAAGKIMESNAVALLGALQPFGLKVTVSPPLPDEPRLLSDVLAKGLQTQDVILVTGGVSVGPLDLVKDVLKEHRVETLFWKVAQKPGKPLYFGKTGKSLVFGLPGNPASSLVCFYEYAAPALRCWLGYSDIFPPVEEGRLQIPLHKSDNRTHFIRAVAKRKRDGLWVFPLASQESHRMRSFAEANCLLYLPPSLMSLKMGDAVKIHWI